MNDLLSQQCVVWINIVYVMHKLVFNNNAALIFQITYTCKITAKHVKMRMATETILSYLPLSHCSGQILDMYLPLFCASTTYFGGGNLLKVSLKTSIFYYFFYIYLRVYFIVLIVDQSIGCIVAPPLSMVWLMHNNTMRTTFWMMALVWSILPAFGLLQCRQNGSNSI